MSSDDHSGLGGSFEMIRRTFPGSTGERVRQGSVSSVETGASRQTLSSFVDISSRGGSVASMILNEDERQTRDMHHLLKSNKDSLAAKLSNARSLAWKEWEESWKEVLDQVQEVESTVKQSRMRTCTFDEEFMKRFAARAARLTELINKIDADYANGEGDDNAMGFFFSESRDIREMMTMFTRYLRDHLPK